MVAAAVAAAILACRPQPGLGSVAYTSAGALHVLDLGTCQTTTLVGRGAGWPVRFSHDGRWIGFGGGRVVSVHGGRVLQPVGPLYTWAWSPTQDLIAGITSRGAVVQGGPGRKPRVRAPADWGAQTLAWSPDGLAFAVGRAKFQGLPSPKGLQRVVVFAAGRGVSVGYRTPKGQLAPPQVVGWVPLPRGAGRLQAMLPVPGFFLRCGAKIVVAGSDRDTETNKRIVVGTFRPGYLDYRIRNLSRDPTRAWVSPACSPDARSIAVAAGPDHAGSAAIRPARSIWLLSLDGRRRRRLTQPPQGSSDDGPLWAANGKAVLFARERGGRGGLYEATLDGRLIGPLAQLRGALVGVGVSSWPVDSR